MATKKGGKSKDGKSVKDGKKKKARDINPNRVERYDELVQRNNAKILSNSVDQALRRSLYLSNPALTDGNVLYKKRIPYPDRIIAVVSMFKDLYGCGYGGDISHETIEAKYSSRLKTNRPRYQPKELPKDGKKKFRK